MLREYRFSWNELLQTPIKRFWFLLNQIDRLRAEQGLEQLQIIASAGSVEAYKATTDQLRKEIGQIYVVQPKSPSHIVVDPDEGLDPEFDRAALRRLKAKIASGR